MADLASQLSALNPFTKVRRKKEVDEEDKGEQITYDAISKPGAYPAPSRVSHALQSFLAHHGALPSHAVSHDETGALEHLSDDLRALLREPAVKVPAALLDANHPLPEYFVSSSHNTYLLAHQLYGTSCASGYETALRTGSRCVEIDAWDNEDDPNEPKVTHGFTLVSHIPFRSVCETIAAFWDEEATKAQNEGGAASPILISLENHCKAPGQLRLVQIMKEVFGHRLLSEAVRDKGTREQEGSGEHVKLAELGGRIAVIVEYHVPGEAEASDSSLDDSEDEAGEREARKTYQAKKKEDVSSIIIPELADLGVYAQSVKPGNTSWFDSPAGLTNGPHHHLINVSESGLNGYLKDHSQEITKHNSLHLMRVFPKGLRISSSNLRPVPYWGVGAQICALNWQTFGAGNQLNEALFAGTDGYVLKPQPLRAGGDGLSWIGRKKRLRLHVAGATDVPVPADATGDDGEAKEFRPYLTCTLHHPSDLSNSPPKCKTSPYKHHKLGFLHRGENPPSVDPVWDETLEWTYDDSEMVFLRMMIKDDASWARNPVLAVSAVRLLYVQPGAWRFVRMRDLHGAHNRCTLLVKFEFEEA